MCKKLIIKSYDNEDWNGTWLKGEVEREMRELDQKPTGNEWISWVLDHMFMFTEFTAEVENVIENCDALTTMTFRFDDGDVTITKA